MQERIWEDHNLVKEMRREGYKMAARTVQILLTNHSGFALTKSFDHLCGGDWTPQLRPPDTIADGAKVTWKSESGGIATGTEAYVKYTVDGNGDTVYIYWDNPFTLGVTKVTHLVSTQDIEPDCDFEKTKGGAAFPPPPSKFDLFKTLDGVGEGGEGFFEVPLAPLLVLGDGGIIDHKVVDLTLGQKTTSLRTFALRRRMDLTTGIRSHLSSSSIAPRSLRSLMGL
jgi:hypothetical protein